MARRVLIPLLALPSFCWDRDPCLGKPNLRLDEGTGLELSSGNGRTTSLSAAL